VRQRWRAGMQLSLPAERGAGDEHSRWWSQWWWSQCAGGGGYSVLVGRFAASHTLASLPAAGSRPSTPRLREAGPQWRQGHPPAREYRRACLGDHVPGCEQRQRGLSSRKPVASQWWYRAKPVLCKLARGGRLLCFKSHCTHIGTFLRAQVHPRPAWIPDWAGGHPWRLDGPDVLGRGDQQRVRRPVQVGG
jgi:hypothetical protein